MTEKQEPTRDEIIQSMIDAEMVNAWSAVLATDDGRKVIWSILSMCHLYHLSYSGNSLSNLMEGERNIGLRILNERIFPNGVKIYAEMLLDDEKWRKDLENAIEEEELKQQESQENE